MATNERKRVMISQPQPMNGLSEEQIKADRAEAIAWIESMGFEYVDNFITDTPPANCNQPLWYLAKSLEIMATCDDVLLLPGWVTARGCQLEEQVARAYGISCWQWPWIRNSWPVRLW